MPPRHGKSWFLSQYLPAWYLGIRPHHNFILAGYGSSFASEWGRKVRNVLEEYGPSYFGIEIADDSRAADKWKIKNHEGGMYSLGVGASITGRGGNVIGVDDPIKNSQEANSEVYRDKIWDWWQSTLYTRLEPGGSVIVTHTRWHDDDLIGRLLKQQEEETKAADGAPELLGNIDQWDVINLPAICEVANDPIGRKIGDALWPTRRWNEKAMAKIKRAVGEYVWSALYQQSPTIRTGGFFHTDKFNYVDSSELHAKMQSMGAGLKFARAWDLAATEGDGDYTVGAKGFVDSEGRLFVVDVDRGQWSTDRRDGRIKSNAVSDGSTCRIRLPQDPGQAGKSQASHFARLLTGYKFTIRIVSGDKTTRADPVSSQVNAGNVFLVRAAWNKSFVSELQSFDKGTHDDQVDAFSDLYDELTGKRRFFGVA